MSLWRGIRWSTAWLFLPLIVVATYAGAVSEQAFFGDYRLVAISQAWVTLVVVGPLLAGWAAWDSARLRHWLDSSLGGGHRAKALARALAPAMAGTMLLVLVTVLSVTGLPNSLIGWTVMAAALLTMVAAGVVGAALGVVAPRLVATPLAIAATYGILGFAVATPAQWPARGVLTGVLAPCCAPAEQVSGSALASAMLACCLVMAGGWLAVATPVGVLRRASMLAGSIAIAVASVWSIGTAMGPYGQVAARSTPTVCSSEGDERVVCVWPEHLDQLTRIRETLSAGERVAQSAGLQLPGRWSESPHDGGVYFLWASAASAAEHKFALSIDIAHWAGCTGPDEETDVSTYLALRSGLSPDDLAQRNPDLGRAAHQIADLSEPEQQQWLRQRLQECRA